ncbi:XAC2610-related protein [Chitinophagaceae bacterium MMS25-I14]
MIKAVLTAVCASLFLASCTSPTPKNNMAVKTGDTITRKDTAVAEPVNTKQQVFDTTLTPFADTSYQLHVHMVNWDNPDIVEEENNTAVTFQHAVNGNTQLVFRDSFYCMQPMIEGMDMNDDGVPDLAIFYNTGARANPTYHLYLLDTAARKLHYVKGFEELPNAGLDTSNNIIASVALAGLSNYSFYRITAQNKLVNLGYSFEADIEDSGKYDKAIRQIVKQYGK